MHSRDLYRLEVTGFFTYRTANLASFKLKHSIWKPKAPGWSPRPFYRILKRSNDIISSHLVDEHVHWGIGKTKHTKYSSAEFAQIQFGSKWLGHLPRFIIAMFECVEQFAPNWFSGSLLWPDIRFAVESFATVKFWSLIYANRLPTELAMLSVTF